MRPLRFQPIATLGDACSKYIGNLGLVPFRRFSGMHVHRTQGVVRGAHVHVDYHEFYTLPRGRVLLGLSDIRRASPTYRTSVQIEWADKDGFAVAIPPGVAHVVLFEEDSVLAFGLSDYWKAEYDVVGCQWDEPDLSFKWPTRPVVRSRRDAMAGSYGAMLQHYEELFARINGHPK